MMRMRMMMMRMRNDDDDDDDEDEDDDDCGGSMGCINCFSCAADIDNAVFIASDDIDKAKVLIISLLLNVGVVLEVEAGTEAGVVLLLVVGTSLITLISWISAKVLKPSSSLVVIVAEVS